MNIEECLDNLIRSLINNQSEAITKYRQVIIDKFSALQAENNGRRNTNNRWCEVTLYASPEDFLKDNPPST